LSISFARAVGAPEIFVARPAVGTDDDCGFAHALQERPAGNRLIVSVGDDDKRATQELVQISHRGEMQGIAICNL